MGPVGAACDCLATGRIFAAPARIAIRPRCGVELKASSKAMNGDEPRETARFVTLQPESDAPKPRPEITAPVNKAATLYCQMPSSEATTPSDNALVARFNQFERI